MRFWCTTKFIELQRSWYRRLADDGFVDAEELIGTEMWLRQTAEHSVAGEAEVRIASREAYYRLLRAHAADEKFDSDIDRIIMTMAAEGARQKEIERTLNALSVRRPPRFLSEHRRCRESIRLTIRKYERRWGLRKDAA